MSADSAISYLGVNGSMAAADTKQDQRLTRYFRATKIGHETGYVRVVSAIALLAKEKGDPKARP
jgi:hypothetical protein